MDEHNESRVGLDLGDEVRQRTTGDLSQREHFLNSGAHCGCSLRLSQGLHASPASTLQCTASTSVLAEDDGGEVLGILNVFPTTVHSKHVTI